MSSASQPAGASAGQAPTLVRSRLEALRFPPAFFAAVAATSLGDLGALWQRLSETEREQLADFERIFRTGHRFELRGDTQAAGRIYRHLVTGFPRFRTIALERLATIGQPVSEDIDE